MLNKTRFNLLDLNLQNLRHWMNDHFNLSSRRADELLQAIHQRGITNFSSMENFNETLRSGFSQQAFIEYPQIISHQISPDETQKWLLRLQDNNAIETVFIPTNQRGTLCISSQAGCSLNCSFCATGRAGFNRNLTLAEIIGQVLFAKIELQKNSNTITNIVFMGMGEPLCNEPAVIDAAEILLHDFAYGLSKYRVTISTSGMVPAMQRLFKVSPVSIAVSLHAPNNILRNELVPLNKKYPLELLIPVCAEYAANSGRDVMFEYVMLDNVNDSLEHAEQLAELIKSVPCLINLIPFNAFPGTRYRCSSLEKIIEFRDRLISYKIHCRVRTTRGQQTSAACAQLIGEFIDRTGRKTSRRAEKHLPSSGDAI